MIKIYSHKIEHQPKNKKKKIMWFIYIQLQKKINTLL
jgi:hypothetical protein